jgi:peptide/nickel transport system substrate-binding protein
MRRYAKIVSVVLCVMLSGVAALAVSHEQLQIGISQEFEYLNRHLQQMSASNYISDMCARGLMILDTTGHWQPVMINAIPDFDNGLAEFIEEDGVKKIKAHFELKEGLKWGDGAPITSADVKFSWDVGMHENISVGEREIWAQIERIELDPEDPLKFTFIYKQARWDFNQLPQFTLLPKHLEGPVFEQHAPTPESYEKNTLYGTDPLNPGLYNGPYRISEIELGSHVVLTPNEHFWGDPPHFQKIVVKLIPDTSTLEANLLSGTIDMISNLGLTFDQAVAFEKRIIAGNLPYRVEFEPSLLYEHLDVQLGNPILQDVRVRKALVYAIDRDALSQALFEGKQPKALHNIAPVDPWYTDDPDKIVLYEYSPRKARQLLDEAGWEMGADGYRYKDGEKLSLQLMTTAGNKTRELVQAWLQEEWKKVGVDIYIENEPARVYFGETVRKSLYKGLAMFAWFSSPENNPRSTMHSSNIPTEDNGWSGQNSMRWVNADVDALIEEIDVTFDHDARVELVAQILYHYTNDVPVIPLYYRTSNAVIPANLQGYHLSPHQYSAANHIEYWHLAD